MQLRGGGVDGVDGAVRAGRLLGVDVARAVALLGMAVTHVFAGTRSDGTIAAGHAVFAGRSSALFAVLAGVSTALLTGGATPLVGPARRRAALALALRALVIAGIGLALVELEASIAIILTYYGVLFLCALPLLGLRARPLLLLGAGAVVVLPLLSYAWRDALDLAPTFEQPELGRLRDDPGQVLEELVLTGYYPVLPWLAYLLVGMGVGRLGLGSRVVALRLLVTGCTVAVLAHVLSALLLQAGLDDLERVVEDPRDLGVEQVLRNGSFGVVGPGSRWLLASDGPHTGTPLDLAATTGSALAVLGACLLLLHLGPAVRAVLLPLAAVGAMTLTLYCLHVWAVSRWDERGPGAFYATQLVLGLVGTLLWRVLVGRGPLEALMAALTRLVRSDRSRRTVG